MKKTKDFIYGFLFIAAFLFIGSGMFEAIIIELLERIGL